MTPEEFSPRRPPAHRLDRRLPRQRRRAAGDGAAAPGRRQAPRCRRRRRTSRSRSTRPARPRPRSSCPGSRTGSTRASSATSPPTARSPACSATSLSTGLGVLGLSWQSSPALTELEEVVTDWMRQMLGLSDAWSGVIQDTASTSTLVALICARERTTGYALGARRPAGRAAAAGRLRLGAQPQLGRQGGAARRLRPRQRARSSPATTQLRDARRTRSPRRSRADLAARPPPVRGRRDHRHHARRRSIRSARSPRSRARHGLWLHVDAAMAGSRDDPAGVPLDVGRRRGRRLAGRQPAQVARRARSTARCTTCATRAPGARDVAPTRATCRRAADGAGQEPARLGHPARAAGSAR